MLPNIALPQGRFAKGRTCGSQSTHIVGFVATVLVAAIAQFASLEAKAELVSGDGEWVEWNMTICTPIAGAECNWPSHNGSQSGLEIINLSYDDYPGSYETQGVTCTKAFVNEPALVPAATAIPDWATADFGYTSSSGGTECGGVAQLRASEFITTTEPPWSNGDVTNKNLGKPCKQSPASASNPCNVAAGNKYEIETDSPGSLLRPAITRHYNSLRHEEDIGLGYGWTASFLKRVEPINGADLRVRRTDGQALRFSNSGSGWEGDPDADLEVYDDVQGYRVVSVADSEQIYDLSGKILSELFIDGASHVYSYDGNGKLERIDGSAGTWLSFTSNPDGHIGTVTNDAGQSWTYRYTGDSLEFVDNPDGTTRQYHYEVGSNLLTGITDETGTRFSTYEYDPDGAVISSRHAGDVDRVDIQYTSPTTRNLTNSRGDQSTYNILIQNKSQLVQSITGPTCATCAPWTTYQYDQDNNLLSVTDRELTTEYGNYDSGGNFGYKIERKGTSDESRTDYTYDSRFRSRIATASESSVSVGNNKVTTYSYDDFGNLTSEVIAGFTSTGTAISRTTSYQYNGPLNQLSQINGPRTDVSDITTLEYWADTASEGSNRARLRRVTLANGVLLRDNIQYTAVGKFASELRPNSLQITYSYFPGNNRLESVTQTDVVSGATRATGFTYLATGEIESITSGLGTGAATTLSFEYDDARRLTRIVDGLGNYISYQLDTEGNPVADEIFDATDQLRFSLTRTFNEFSKISLRTSANESESYDYDTDGRLLYINDANGSSDNIWMSGDRVTGYIENIGGIQATSIFDYDAAGRVYQVRDPNNHYTQYQFDDLDNVLSVNSPDTGLTTLDQHDGAGNLLAKTDANGQQFLYSYDELNRILAIDVVGTTDDDIDYTYDNCNGGALQHCSVTVGAGGSDPRVVSYSYTAFGEAATHQGVSYTYDAVGRVSDIVYPSAATITYHYDAAGQVSQVDLTENGQTTVLASGIGYHPNGPINQMQYGNGNSLTQLVDTAYRLTDINVAGVMSLTGALYDGNGNLTDRTEDFGTPTPTQFTYDAMDRLDTANGEFGVRDYDLDAIGNRLRLDADSVITDYTYPTPNNRVATASGWDFGYDANGSTVSKLSDDGSGDGFSYTYSAFNQLTRVDATGAGAAILGDYRFNGLGQRVSKNTANGITQFGYGLSGELLVEYDGTGAVKREYVFLNGQPLAMLDHDANPPSGVDLIVDDGDPGTAAVGEWVYKSTVGYQGDWMKSFKPAISDYTWSLSLPPGTYEVYGWWQSRNKNSTAANYAIDNGTSSWSSIQDQTANGNVWNLLGTYAIQDPNASVNLSASAGHLSADAVRFLMIEAAPQIDIYYIHNDHLGTPRAMTDESGAAVWTTVYDPFGSATATNPGGGAVVEMNLRFPGQYFDEESGLHYNYFRTYDPSTGRYLESDPIGLNGGLNTYGYVSANPLRYVDPLGLVEWNGFIVYEGIGAGITTNFYNWYLESKCFEGEKLQVMIRGESDFLSSLSVGASATKGKAKITLFDPWAAPSASNLSRTGSNSFVVEALSLMFGGASNITLGDAATDGWDWGLNGGGIDLSLGRIAGETEVLKEEWTSCGCEGQ